MLKLGKIVHVSLIGVLLGIGTASAQPVPQGLQARLQQRESRLNNSLLVWKVQVHESFTNSATQPPTSAMRQKQIQTLIKYYQQRGFNDKKKIRSMANATVDSIDKAGQEHTIIASAIWRIKRQADITLVSGPAPDGLKPPEYYKQIYTGHEALLTSDVEDKIEHVASMASVVWQTTSDSVDYTCPVDYGLRIRPEDFVTLAGFNPLSIYGAAWEVNVSTPQTLVLQADIKAPDHDAETYTITLNKAYGDAVTDIQVTHQKVPMTAEWRITKFHQFQGEWIGGQVDLFAASPKISTVHERFTLVGSSSAKSTPEATVNIGRLDVEDTRLLGKNLTQDDLYQAEADQDHRLIYYPWQGQIPNLETLKKRYEQQHPGEATPDPTGPTSMLPTLGGLACLIGGILTYRRRGKNDA
jgi:hypothetical protein